MSGAAGSWPVTSAGHHAGVSAASAAAAAIMIAAARSNAAITAVSSRSRRPKRWHVASSAARSAG